MKTIQDHLYRAKRLANNVANVLNELSAVNDLSQELTTSILQNTLTLAATQMDIISDDIDEYLEVNAIAQRKEETSGQSKRTDEH